jgi:hypothetical protein
MGAQTPIAKRIALELRDGMLVNLAHGLTYCSQGERAWAGKVTRVQKIRAKLMGDPPPPPPAKSCRGRPQP